MKRTIALLSVLTCLCFAGWVNVYQASLANTHMNGTAACTTAVPLGAVQGANCLVLETYALSNTANDSSPILKPTFQYRGANQASWATAIPWILGTGVDSVLPDTTWLLDTLTGGSAALVYISTITGAAGDSVRLIYTGKRAAQCAKNTKFKIRKFMW